MLEFHKNLFNSIPPSFFKIKEDLCQSYKLDPDNQNELNFLFSPLNPFFEQGTAYLEVIENKARAVVLKHPDVTHEDQSVAYLAYFECIDDLEVCTELLSKCEAWAKKNNINKIIGPINFNTYNQYRINLEEDEKHLFFNEPKNPPYYKNLLSQNNYKILNEYVSYIVKDKSKLEKWYELYHSKKTST